MEYNLLTNSLLQRRNVLFSFALENELKSLDIRIDKTKGGLAVDKNTITRLVLQIN